MELFEMPQKRLPEASEDGVSHINIYSAGNTPVGRWLSNFTAFPVPLNGMVYGSVEAIWYCLKMPKSVPDEEYTALSKTSGYRAKKLGRELVNKYGEAHVDDFDKIIEWAIRHKIAHCPQYVRDAIISSEGKPFEHYYVMHGRAIDAGHKWLINLAEDIRSGLIKERNDE